ncbi:MAG: nucleoside recognition domain-containing protein, partial [Bacteroidia bacterium]
FDAGKVIVIISIVLWVLASYGPGRKFESIELDLDQVNASLVAQENSGNDSLLSTLEEERHLLESQKLEASYAGHLGKIIEPAIEPLGFDWKIGISLITSFAAREVFVGTMATIYSSGGDEENMQPIRERLKTERNPRTGELVYTPATGASLLMFYVFALQCMSTIAVVKRETHGWKWPLIQFFYMGALAWIMSFIVYNLMR